jgi:transposase
MYIERTKKKVGKKIHQQILLRESYRESVNGQSVVKKRVLLNLTKYPKAQVEAIDFALKNQPLIQQAMLTKSSVGFEIQEGKSIGAAWLVVKVAEKLGITKALGRGREAQLALWQIIARVLDQGSRLSAVRLHQTHAMVETIGVEKGFNEDNLYANLAWLSEKQNSIEDRLYKHRRGDTPPTLMLYDVTSSYLEGDQNELAAYGYNRDGKKGKKQIVIGLLCDEFGDPVSVEVFTGNTNDTKTFSSQVQKTAGRFGCKQVTFVGDRGMIKQAQQEELNSVGFHYITALTKKQISTLLKAGTIQMDFFDEKVCEIEDKKSNRRLILRRNPVRAEQLAESRQSKRQVIEALVEKKNQYLKAHPKAQVQAALKNINERLEKLCVNSWLCVEADDRTLRLEVYPTVLNEESMLDGCYVITSDLPAASMDAESIHARYKDLMKVEKAFRFSKTGHLELRPIFVRSEESTRGHVFVVMLAYMIRRELAQAWTKFNITVEEGLDTLKTLCSMNITLGDGTVIQKIPAPRELSGKLLQALDVELPTILPHSEIKVATKKTLPSQRVT